MTRTTITLGRPVGIADVVAIARGGARVAIGSSAMRRLKRSRAVVGKLAAGEKPIYGLNTGLGAGVDTRLTAAEMNEFQARVLIARSVGPLGKLRQKASEQFSASSARA
jgi:histidine ammonia-lyase